MLQSLTTRMLLPQTVARLAVRALETAGFDSFASLAGCSLSPSSWRFMVWDRGHHVFFRKR